MSCNNSCSHNSKRTNKKNKALKKYNILGQIEKQQILESLQRDSSLEMYQTLSDKYNTSIKNLRRWYQDGISRKPGCGRKKLNTRAEEELREWIITESVELRRRVRRSQLKQKAIELFNIPNFKASKAWQDEFIRNFDIKYQKVKFEEQRRKRQAQTKLDQQGEQQFSSQISTDIPQSKLEQQHIDGTKVSEFKLEDDWSQEKYEQQYEPFDFVPKMEFFDEISFHHQYDDEYHHKCIFKKLFFFLKPEKQNSIIFQNQKKNFILFKKKHHEYIFQIIECIYYQIFFLNSFFSQSNLAQKFYYEKNIEIMEPSQKCIKHNFSINKTIFLYLSRLIDFIFDFSYYKLKSVFQQLKQQMIQVVQSSCNLKFKIFKIIKITLTRINQKHYNGKQKKKLNGLMFNQNNRIFILALIYKKGKYNLISTYLYSSIVVDFIDQSYFIDQNTQQKGIIELIF